MRSENHAAVYPDGDLGRLRTSGQRSIGARGWPELILGKSVGPRVSLFITRDFSRTRLRSPISAFSAAGNSFDKIARDEGLTYFHSTSKIKVAQRSEAALLSCRETVGPTRRAVVSHPSCFRQVAV